MTRSSCSNLSSGNTKDSPANFIALLRMSVKAKVSHYLGLDDQVPASVSVRDFVNSHKQGVKPFVKEYVTSLFPIAQWIGRYNLTWFSGDLIAGFTVGMVLVPQSLSYAKLANLDPQYGLYSSFIGVLTYALFATSKDVSIGPVAVMSTITGNIITSVMAGHNQFSAPEIATCLAFICGIIVLAIGLLRIGWIIEFTVSGFMTGSALNIAAGQFPGLFGTSKMFNTKAATYQVIINTFKYLPSSNLDAAFGICSLVALYMFKWGCDSVQKRSSRYARAAFFASAFRHAFVIIIFTIISWRINIHAKPARILLVGTVPSGLRHVGQPHISPDLITALGPYLPIATIVLLLEHISISKSFGRINGYKINPNQELVAIGVNNLVGSCFSAYPSTGSFSRSALKSKSGVRTPLAGVPVGVVVIVALYAVAPAFYWIPNATLSALIIHAVADLVASPRQSIAFWRVAPLEYLIFAGAVLWSVFYTIESGIYWSLATSVVLLLFRIARPKGHFLGRVRIRPDDSESEHAIRDVFVPLHESDGVTNRDIPVEAPPPGIIIYRFEESFLYPNASYINDLLVTHAKEHTRRGKDYTNIPAGDRPWNDPGPKPSEEARLREIEASKPLLRAVILDFSAVANIDTTGVQNLIDTQNAMEKWADGPVDFHFTGILSPWIRRALIAGGFGRGGSHGPALEVAPVVRFHGHSGNADPAHQPEIGPVGPSLTSPAAPEGKSSPSSIDAEEKVVESSNTSVLNQERQSGLASVTSLPLLDRATPNFHFDVADALHFIESSQRRHLSCV